MSQNLNVFKLKNLSSVESVYQSLIVQDIHPVMSKIYALRGIENFNDINLVQKLEPFTNMKNIDLSSKILAKAILQKEKICVVADYDVDGATACTIALRGLKLFGANIDYVVPDRFVHGYGLTPSVVDEAIKKKNPDIIVTVDNGISSYDGVLHAQKKGLRVLVTDHHLPGDKLPPAECIVNPNQPGCQFKSKSLAGCGVMFYVLAALREHMIKIGIYNQKTAPNVFSLLDLVAIGTIADVVKLDLNNRILVRLGLDMIRNKQTKPGVLALINVAKRRYDQLSTTDIGFGLGPRINAAGRLEDMTIGINCLLTDNHDTAEKYAEKLNEINKSRKEIESDMKDEAMDLPSLEEGKFVKIAFSETFHEGVIGIVASRIKEMFYRPTIVFAPTHDSLEIKGSGRSIPEIHLRDALDYVYKKRPDIIVKFGGHAMAAGLTIKKEFLKDFTELFEESVEYFADGKDLLNVKEIDLDLETEFINCETAEMIRDEVWGQGFMPPLFMGQFKVIGQKVLKDAHLKLNLEKDGRKFEAMWFFHNEPITESLIDVTYSLGINEFMGETKVQIMIDNIMS